MARAAAILLGLLAFTGCTSRFPEGLTIQSPYGGGTLGGIDQQREGGMRNLYGWR